MDDVYAFAYNNFMRRKIALISIAFFIASIPMFALPVKVSALKNPALMNLTPEDQSEEVCQQASGGIEKYCATGLGYAIFEAGAQIFNFSNVSFTDKINIDAALGRGDVTAAQTILRNAKGVGLGGFILNASYAMLEQRPASGVIFAMDQIDKAVSPEPVMAADPQPYFPGTGFSLMTPIQSFWGWSVTISYSFMILIIVGVAFALMFRAQLDGTTVVQLQNAIPGIVAAMILIPLSYPISGLFIDAITLSTNVYHDFIFGPAGPGRDVYTDSLDQQGKNYNGQDTRGLYADDWRLNVFRFYEGVGINKLGDIAEVSICPAEATDTQICTVANQGILGFVKGVLEFFFGSVSTVLGTVLNFLFSLVAIIVSIRIAKRLLIKLILLMFFPIAAPFIFATIAIPGQGTKNLIGFLKSMAAASLFFIATYIIFTTTLVLTNEAFYQNIPNVSTYEFRPPLLGDLGAFVTGTVTGNVGDGLGASGFLFTIVGAFLFLSTPKILDTIDEKLEVPPDFIPKALKPYIEDIGYSADYGLRQAPATARVAVDTLGGGAYRNTVGLIGKRIGAQQEGGIFDETNAEKFVSARRKEIAALLAEKENPNTGFVRKRQIDVQVAALRAGGNLRTGFYGEGNKFTPKAGEEGVNFSIEVEVPSLPSYGLSTFDAAKLMRDNPNGITGGAVTITVPDKGTPPQGGIIFKTYNSATKAIGRATFGGDPGETGNLVELRIAPSEGTQVTSQGIALTKRAFAGNNKVRVSIIAVFVGEPKSGLYSTTPDATDVQVAINEVKKSGRFSFNIR